MGPATLSSSAKKRITMTTAGSWTTKVAIRSCSSTTPTIEFSADAVEVGPDARAQILDNVDTLRGLIMGYDVSAARARAVLADVERLAGSLPVDDGVSKITANVLRRFLE